MVAVAALPPQAYVEETHAAREAAAVFARGWLPIRRGDQVEEPGDYITIDVAGYQAIVSRHSDGQLHAFANSCRHRGARLLDGRGNCTHIRCPFHNWTYHVDGRLTGAPQM